MDVKHSPSAVLGISVWNVQILTIVKTVSRTSGLTNMYSTGQLSQGHPLYMLVDQVSQAEVIFMQCVSNLTANIGDIQNSLCFLCQVRGKRR